MRLHSRRTRSRGLLLLIGAMLLLGLLSLVTVLVSSALKRNEASVPNVSLEQPFQDAGKDAPSLGAWLVDITYDSSVVSVADCQVFGSGACDSAYGADTIRVTGKPVEQAIDVIGNSQSTGDGETRSSRGSGGSIPALRWRIAALVFAVAVFGALRSRGRRIW